MSPSKKKKSTAKAKAKVKAPTKPGLLKYGYWSYPDPSEAICKLLEKKPELLEAFEELINDGSDYSAIQDWAEENVLSSAVMKLVRQADPGNEGMFDEVEIASGTPPDMDGMLSSVCLFARRVQGVIEYRSDDDMFDAPDSTTEPLSEDDAWDFVSGSGGHDLEEIVETWGSGESLESTLRAVESWGRSASFYSDFYDFDRRWNEYVNGMKEEAQTNFEADIDE